MLEIPTGESGVLPSHWLRKAVDAGVVDAGRFKIPESSIQPASIDLRLGETAHRLRCSFLPDQHRVDEKLADYGMDVLDLRDGAILERNRPYLIPLLEEVNLPPGIRAKANPKSSTGRLDIFTRVITDKSFLFDEIEEGYSGRLYIEVVSRSFTIKVKTGLSLNQLRLMAGAYRFDDTDIRRLHAEDSLLFVDGVAVPPTELAVGNGLFLSLDLVGDDQGRVGYRAKKNSHLLDLSHIDHYDPDEFWEPVKREKGNRVVLEPEEFYLLLSHEGVRVPPAYAAEMTAYDPTSGELRTHYAGFFDPGFGHGADPLTGSRAALEVRAHDVPFMVEHRQPVCKLGYERMLETPSSLYGEGLHSHYQFQSGTLSKHFKRP
ncbi:MAG TPA: 2'-deoxycytidine 5'-triphosphate deaminase [Mycobacteriales bacterium]|nr:2'-deoxycytidine 5'-triphosphate deaminase [Mycobacteriales bacterium]